MVVHVLNAFIILQVPYLDVTLRDCDQCVHVGYRVNLRHSICKKDKQTKSNLLQWPSYTTQSLPLEMSIR